MADRITMAKTATDDELLEKCKEVGDNDDCGSIEWITPENNVRTWPPEHTSMLIADIHTEGAINIYETPRDKYVGGVGQKESSQFVIVPWRSNWWYYSIGSLRIGYVKGKT